ncbi:hypothetical protein [Chitinophaga vietnamensis]|uniref:hypothetical protein n=1 Tax=Chitinophaga vietnamensis TaxID=2593957 RepID=UPI001178B1AE|nr:hypothetical protein [Chitinophaga vietnamensis]
MKYLLCNHCQHANAIKSEYLTFCEQCGKKMANNFSDWHQSRPMADFDEYRQAVAVEIKERKPKPVAAWTRRQFQPGNRGKVVLFFSVLMIMIATAGTLFGKRAVFTLLYPKVPKSSLYSNWQTATIGRQALEISTPVKLWVHDRPLDREEAKTVEYVKSYSNEDGGGIQITVNLRSYQSNVSNDLEDAVASCHREMQLQRQISEIQCKSVPVLISGAPGVLEEGSYLYKGAIRLTFANLVAVRGASRWQIHINYREDDPVGQEVARRVMKSVKIK